MTETPRWTPDRATWEAVKRASIKAPATVTVYGFDDDQPERVIAKDSIRFYTAKDPVDATVLYRQVQLPFQVDEKNFRKMKWRLGDIASYEPPPVIMENLPICASCHLVSKDGATLSMEMNYRDDSGAHVIVPVEKRIRVSDDDIVSWSDFPKPEILPPTRGLFAKLSPSGEYMVTTIHEVSYSAVTTDKGFSQLFFPTYGVLAWYGTKTEEMHLLPGADDTDFIQTEPSWRWDEQEIAFSKSTTMNAYIDDISQVRTHTENVGIHALNERFPIQFNVYRMPFNRGKGGPPLPVEGAAFNGMSNYFPRYSPDGRWLVFTRSKSGIMLQPDSALFIVPSTGGEARRMGCNLEHFNSWHSFSPNGKWMLFTSKTRSPYTEIFLTHIDEQGNDTPPVCLSRFSDDNYAANVPEFVNLAPDAIKRIRIREGR